MRTIYDMKDMITKDIDMNGLQHKRLTDMNEQGILHAPPTQASPKKHCSDKREVNHNDTIL